MSHMLRYDDRFFNRMYGGEGIFSVGERVTELEYRDVLRGWKRLFEEPTTEFDRRLIMSAGDDQGMVELTVYGDDHIESMRPVVGPEAWGLLPYSGPVPSPEIGDALRKAFRRGAALEDALAAMPAGTWEWWGDEDVDGGHLHYLILNPPALLTVRTEGDRITTAQILDHRNGARLLTERLEANGLLPIRLTLRDDYTFPETRRRR